MMIQRSEKEKRQKRTKEFKGGWRMEDGGWTDSDMRTMVALSLFRPESTEGIGRYREGIKRV